MYAADILTRLRWITLYQKGLVATLQKITWLPVVLIAIAKKAILNYGAGGRSIQNGISREL